MKTRLQHRTVSLASLCLLGLAAGCGAAPEAPRPLNLVVVVPDTLRADRLGLYGYQRSSSPRLDEWARTAFVFDNAQSAAPWTAPSLLTLMTSLYPDVHQVLEFPDPGRMGEEVLTLAEVLKARGYRTAAFTEGGYAKGVFGLAQGFDLYPSNPGDDEGHDSNLDHPSRLEGNLDRTLEWLEAHREQPFFLFFQTYEPHFPWRAPEELIRRFHPNYDEQAEHEQLGSVIATWNRDRRMDVQGLLLLERHRLHCRLQGQPDPQDAKRLEALGRRVHRTAPYLTWAGDIYDAEIAYTDEQLDRLWQVLAADDLDRRTVVVVVSDHGEGLGDHGHLFHGSVLHEELLRLVLLIRVPGDDLRPRRIDAVVRAVDIMPTVLDLLGLEHDALPLQGTSLRPVLAGEDPQLTAFGQATINNGGRARRYTVRDGRWRLIVNLDSGARRLYDLAADPGETVNVADRHEDVVTRLRGLLDRQLEADRAVRELIGAERGDVELDEDLLEQLRSLGYLGEAPDR